MAEMQAEISMLRANLLTMAQPSPQSQNGAGMDTAGAVTSLKFEVAHVQELLAVQDGNLRALMGQVQVLEQEVVTLKSWVGSEWVGAPYVQEPSPSIGVAASPVPAPVPCVFDLNQEGSEAESPKGAISLRDDGGTSVRGEGDRESQMVRTKDLHQFKVPPLPSDAGSFRAWKNALKTQVMSYDRSPDGSLTQWFQDAILAKTTQQVAQLQDSSGDFPRFDRVLAYALCRPEMLRSLFGVRFQAYLEEMESENRQVRGRVLLNMVCREYATDRSSGAIVTALELYQLPAPQETAAALRQWRDKVTYVMNQIAREDKPEPKLLARWLYDRLKHHPLMRRHVDKVRDAPDGSSCKSFDWLWNQVDVCVQESQQDANAASIQEALRRGPSKPPRIKDGADAAGLAAKGSDGFGKGSEKGLKGKPKGLKGLSKSDGKGKSKDKSAAGKGGKPKGEISQLTAEQKALQPCIYHQKGKCFRGDKCPYSHTIPAHPATPAEAVSAKPKAAPKGSAVAKAMVALVAATTATRVSSAQCEGPFELEFVGDTGAGEWLGSWQAFVDQGVAESHLAWQVSDTPSPLKFQTGGGRRMPPRPLRSSPQALATSLCTCWSDVLSSCLSDAS